MSDVKAATKKEKKYFTTFGALHSFWDFWTNIVELLDTFKHKGLRKRLIEQIADKGITDEEVLKAMGAIPRHFFVEGAFAEEAYMDKALPIHNDQTISQPFTVAYQTQLLALRPNQKVLEIGTGSGYQAAILAQLGYKVYSVERDSRLAKEAAKRLSDLELPVTLHQGDGSQGWTDHAPYDAILVTAASPKVPTPLLQQLNPKGRLVIPIGPLSGQRMAVVTKIGKDEYKTEHLQGFRFVPLVGKYGFPERD